MHITSLAAILACVAASPGLTHRLPTPTCPAYAPHAQSVATAYLDTLFGKNFNASLDFWVPGGSWWTIGTKAVVPWAGFTTVEQHTPIIEKILAPFDQVNYYPWNWVVADSERKLAIEMWLDWYGPTSHYEANATSILEFDEDWKILSLHEYLDLTQQPQNITAH